MANNKEIFPLKKWDRFSYVQFIFKKVNNLKKKIQIYAYCDINISNFFMSLKTLGLSIAIQIPKKKLCCHKKKKKNKFIQFKKYTIMEFK